MDETDDTSTTIFEPGMLKSLLADMERGARLRGNPLFAWNAIDVSVKQNHPIPDFALEYIKTVAAALAPFTTNAILRKPDNKVTLEEISRHVLDALRITTGGGRPNAFENMRRDCQADVALANEPLREVREAIRKKKGQRRDEKPEQKAAADKDRRRKLARAKELRGWTKPTP